MRSLLHASPSARRVLMAAVVVTWWCGRPAHGEPIRFEFKGVGSGSLAAKSFENAPFAIQLSGDTANVARNVDVYTLAGPSSFYIGGVGSGDFAITTRVFSNNGIPAVGFSRGGASGSDLVDLFEVSLAGYDLKKPFGLVREEDPQAVSQFRDVDTTAGLLTFSSMEYVTFQAFPEPSSAALLIGLAGAATLRRSRRVGKGKLLGGGRASGCASRRIA